MEQFLGLPPDASAHGPALDHLTVLVHLLMAVMFLGWGTFFVYALIRFRSKANPRANYYGVKHRYSTYIEGIVAICEVVLLVGFSVPLWGRRVNARPAENEATVIRIVAEQFAWNIHYPGPDGKFGKASLSLVSSDNPVGLDRTDPDAKDDIVTLNQLWLPVNKPVIIHLTTKDVIHSLSIPYMRVKQDAIPGEEIPLWFTPVKTSEQVREEVATLSDIRSVEMDIDKAAGMTSAKDYSRTAGHLLVKTGEPISDTVVTELKESGIRSMVVYPDLTGSVAMEGYSDTHGGVILKKGDPITDESIVKLNGAGITKIRTAPQIPIEIACAQLCGLGHYRMRGYVNVVTQQEFDAWAAGQAGALQ